MNQRLVVKGPELPHPSLFVDFHTHEREREGREKGEGSSCACVGSFSYLVKDSNNANFTLHPSHPKQTERHSSAFHSNWNQISITSWGFATPDVIDGINKHTNLGQLHKDNPIRNNSRVTPQNWLESFRWLFTTRLPSTCKWLYKL